MNRFILSIILLLAFISPLGINGIESSDAQNQTQQDADYDYIQYKEHTVFSRGENHNKPLTIIISLILISICVLQTISTKKIRLFLFCTAKLFKHLENLIPVQFQSKLFIISFTKA